MLFLWLVGCAYSVEDWWNDQARAQCTCEQSEPARTCRLQVVEELESGPYGNCADHPAPVDRTEMKLWIRDYRDNCRLPDDEMPQPKDPDWFLECQ